MNVQVKHNGTTITGRVISYEREHRICSGIGTLQLVVEGTYSTDFDPWDTVDIWENGDFKVRYYVSASSHSVPDGTITVECQDKSKKLVDYFISTSYIIDYPSYTRTWIETFLTEAGITYDFRTSSSGNLLSNYTNLGLQPAYDQIMMLLQLSGWYMFFDGNGVAVIGPLDTELSESAGTLSKTDIIDIKRVSNDKMLRNRAVVWGEFDPVTQEFAFADVSKRTPWNYDSRDQRTIVISNNNIPNRNSAYGIANMLIKEFSRITVEKHIVAWGARDYTLGTAVNVRSGIWRGRGLITTFGVSMSRNGLVTNVVLDERCPRLFGFFDFGDYVYVSTFGDGVWRKHIKFDPAWYNFSSGLTDLNITDLHVNNEIFGSVAASGAMFYANSAEGPWHEIAIAGLMSSVEDTVIGSGVTYTTFSGIRGRATIVDKYMNIVKYGVDTWSGMNYGDYFLMYSGIVAGGISSSGVRGWVVEYDPFTGLPVGDLGSGVYPISLSGNYNMQVLDLENDGLNDYVSVKEGSGDSIPNNGTEFNYGFWLNQPYAKTRDYDTFTVFPSDTAAIHKDVNNAASTSVGLRTASANALMAVDNPLSGKRYAFAIGKDGKARKYTVTRTFDEFDNRWEVSGSTQTSATAFSALTTAFILGIHPDHNGDNIFRIYYTVLSVFSDDDYFYVDYNASTDTWGSATLITNDGIAPSAGTSITASSTQAIVVDGIIYTLRYYVNHDSPSGDTYEVPSELHVYMIKINMSTSAATVDHLLELITDDDIISGKFAWFPGSNHNIGGHEAIGTFARTTFGLYQNVNGVKIIGWTEVYVSFGGTTHSWEYVFAGNDLVLQTNNIYNDTTFRMPNSGNVIGVVRLTENIGIVGRTATSSSDLSFVFDGTIFQTYTGVTSTPDYWNSTKIFPIFVTGNNNYIVKVSSDYYIYDASTLDTTGTLIVPPTDFLTIKPYSTPIGTNGTQVYFALFNPDFDRSLVRFDMNSLTFDISDYIVPNNVTLEENPGISFGGFFITQPINYGGVDPLSEVIYVDMGIPASTSRFLVLQREGSDFNLIQESSKPIRIEISNTSPELSVDDTEPTFVSNFIYENEVTAVSPITGQNQEVDDYRYTLLEPISSGYTVSGYPAATTILYVHGSGIYGTDVNTYSGGFIKIFDVPSGSGTRIETSNYGLNGQYIFIVASGSYQTFYQKNPTGVLGVDYFVEYSGLPQTRATMIRLDDSL